MSREEKLRIFCYDVSCNKRRRKIAKCLEEVASRVQYSVFEARLSPNKLEQTIDDISEYLKDSDNLRVYTIGKSGEKLSKVYGSGVPIDNDSGFWLL
ncbi:MAG: CRISPR-associated endonuclease Cas2 [Rickettsiales bacterium]|nr:CRISPR-associated endonuclease Cas2 [Pseudomonadota bacterium]MDG4544113.1 CRISPR-associated endonuclease Cas2 [Rickettsiales bacterium]MDG4546294.1 CRISPR-associated endonuclease Cas2 [Rickettsiales bacterium]MDG4548437.1 CRISPR-associated endonuclease Cas2 [Rickettsiales bacterium]